MSGQLSDHEREVRDTIVKSSLTGVAATVLAVTVFSPAGLGGMIGTSVASGFGLDATASADEDPYANLPAYPAPLTRQELSDIRGKLAATTASLEITRAATEDNIEQVRALAISGDLVTFAPMPSIAPNEGLRLTLSEPVTYTPPAVAAPVAPIEPVAPLVAENLEMASMSAGGGDAGGFDSHLEFADLLLSYDN